MSAVDLRIAPAHREDRGLRWGTALRLAAAGGRADGTRIALTALGAAAATLALDTAVTVAATGEGDGPYASAVLDQPGLHPGVVTALALLCLPVLAFVGQCARIGAPARDRRLASLRLAGATPADVVRIAASETGLSAAVGVVVGTVGYFGLRALLDDPVTATRAVERTVHYANGGTGYRTDLVTGPALRLPTDVLPPWWVLLLVAVVIPVAAALSTVLALRRVTVSPFGVVRREQQRPLRVLPVVLFAGGTAGMAAFTSLVRLLHLRGGSSGATAALFGVLLLATTTGLVLGTSALSAGIGSLLATRSRRPSLLITGRRLLAAPAQASRSHAALLLVVLVWAFAQGVRVWFQGYGSGGAERSTQDFYTGAMDLVDLGLAVCAGVLAAGLLVGTVEGVVSRRRVLASMTAAGVPRGVLHRAVLVEALVPLAPAVVLAACAGILGARGVLGTSVVVTRSDGAGGAVGHRVPLHLPWDQLGLLAAGTLLAVLAVTALALPLLHRSADPAELRAE